ncbi:MAG: hypothetical protein ACREJC_14315 [Tepidisphaeraceae bacterium]
MNTSSPAIDRSERVPAAWCIAVFTALSLAASLTSESFLEADGCTHYLYARFAFSEWHYFINIWGRPLCTILYSLPANLFGRVGVRTTSLFLAIGCAMVAYTIARRQGERRPILALLFTLAQPLVFFHSFSELTELPFALVLGLAFVAYQKRSWGVMTLLTAISPLARPEGFGFIALAAVALVCHCKGRWIALLPIPLIIWDWAGWELYGRPSYRGFAEQLPHWLRWLPWLPQNWPYADTSAYKSGSLFHFAMLLPAVVSPLIFPAMPIGIWRCFSHTRLGNFLRDHRVRCDWLVAIIPLSVLAGHSLLYFTGRMSSSGELRYMLVVAPFWGVLCARGWDWAFATMKWRREMGFAALAAVFPLFINRAYQVLPLAVTEDWLHARRAADWVRQHPLRDAYPQIMSSHPGVLYFLNVSPTDPTLREWRRQTIARAPLGTILIWDEIYGVHNADLSRSIPLSAIIEAGWVPLVVPAIENGTRDKPSTWLVFLSPRDARGRPTTRPNVRR